MKQKTCNAIKKTCIFKFPEELYDSLSILAMLSGMSLNGLCQMLIENVVMSNMEIISKYRDLMLDVKNAGGVILPAQFKPTDSGK